MFGKALERSKVADKKGRWQRKILRGSLAPDLDSERPFDFSDGSPKLARHR